MKLSILYNAFSAIVILMILAPALSMAQPAGPGDGSDPFETPVNGYIASVAVIAFIYGAYKMYQLAKKNSAGNI